MSAARNLDLERLARLLWYARERENVQLYKAVKRLRTLIRQLDRQVDGSARFEITFRLIRWQERKVHRIQSGGAQ